MADLLDANGLQTATYEELRTQLTTALTDFLGSDVSFDSNTPDGQLVNIEATAGVDIRGLIKSVFNSYNPDLAQGLALDNICQINGIQRQGGSFTLQEVQITVDRNLTLQGLDLLINSIDGTGFIVADTSGNQFILANTTNLTVGVNNLVFRAKDLGQITTTSNTISVPVSVVVGVVSVNNSTGATEIGKSAELDVDLRVRRKKSVSKNGNNSVNSIYANLINLSGVVQVFIQENTSDIIDIYDIPSHSIWCIIEGGADLSIANTINTYKSTGCGMKGDVIVDITNIQGTVQQIKFSRPQAENLYIKFDLKRTTTGYVFNQPSIKDYITQNLDYKINQDADGTTVGDVCQKAVLSLGGGGIPLNIKISQDGASWVDYLTTTNIDRIFTTNSSIITITEI